MRFSIPSWLLGPATAAIVVLLPLAAVANAAGDSSVVRAAETRDQKTLRTLLTGKADVNAPTADGTTALHWAAHWNDLEAARLLVKAGGNANAANRYGATPLWQAASKGYADMVATLLAAGADPNTLAVGGETALMRAARIGSLPTVKALLARGANPNIQEARRGQTALMWAVGDFEPHPDVVRALLDAGADVSSTAVAPAYMDERGRVPHREVVSLPGKITALGFAIRQNDKQAVKMLIDAGADVNDNRMPEGMTPLLLAISNGYEDVALMLIERGANPRTADEAGFTPLHAAMRRRGAGRASAAVLKALLARGADVHAQLPAKPEPPNHNPIAYPPIMDAQYGGATPFWIAATNIDLEGMRILMAAGADPKKPAMLGTTPLMMAAGLGFGLGGPSARLGGRRDNSDAGVIAACEQLLAWGNDINTVNENGQTAIYGAAMSASAAVVQYLAERGARLDLKDINGRDPLQVADDNRTDKFRSNQSLEPVKLEATHAKLQSLLSRSDAK